MTLAIGANLLPIAAAVGRAPAAISGLGSIEKDPAAFRRIAHFQPIEPPSLSETIELGQYAAELVCAFRPERKATSCRRQQQWKGSCRRFQAFVEVAVLAALGRPGLKECAQCLAQGKRSTMLFFAEQMSRHQQTMHPQPSFCLSTRGECIGGRVLDALLSKAAQIKRIYEIVKRGKLGGYRICVGESHCDTSIPILMVDARDTN
jgi:hypothetical protein